MSAPQKRSGSESPKGRRGRPALKIQKTKDTSDPRQSNRSVIDHYEETRVTYEFGFFTQQLCLMLQRLALRPVYQRFPKEPVYQLLVKTTKEVMLTELEVALWGIIMRRTEGELDKIDLMLYLRITAFAGRKTTEGDLVLNGVDSYLDLKPGFRRFFPPWYEANKDRLEIPLYELNEEYQTLIKPISPSDLTPMMLSYTIDEFAEYTPLSSEGSEEEESKPQAQQLEQPSHSFTLLSGGFNSGLFSLPGSSNLPR